MTDAPLLTLAQAKLAWRSSRAAGLRWRRRLRTQRQLANAFVWRLFARVGDEAFARGLFPTDEQKLGRFETALAAMLFTGCLGVVCSSVIAPAALFAMISTGRSVSGGSRVRVRLARASTRKVISRLAAFVVVLFDTPPCRIGGRRCCSPSTGRSNTCSDLVPSRGATSTK